MASKVLLFWIFAISGAGKSALCNTLVNDKNKKKFPETKPTRSSNQEFIKIVPVTLRTGHSATLVDTEGFSSPDIPEQTLYDQTYERLKEVKSVNRFVLVLNSSEPRVDAKIQKMVGSFVTMIGVGILNYLSVVFTRWSHDSRTKYNFTGNVPCHFIDCGFEEDEEGADKCLQQLEDFIGICVNSAPFETTNIQRVNLNPVINYNTASNSENGDIYNRRMAARRLPASRIEAYFDNRVINVVPSLINDISDSLREINRSNDTNWFSEQNYKASVYSALPRPLSDRVQFSLTRLLKESLDSRAEFNLPRGAVTNIDQPLREDVLISPKSGAVAVLGVVLGWILSSVFGLDLFLAIIIGIILCAGAYFFYIKSSWNPNQVNSDIAPLVTQRIAYTNGLKRICIEFMDEYLEHGVNGCNCRC